MKENYLGAGTALVIASRMFDRMTAHQINECWMRLNDVASYDLAQNISDIIRASPPTLLIDGMLAAGIYYIGKSIKQNYLGE